MKITFFEVKDWEKEYLNKKLSNNVLQFTSEKLNLENIQQAKDSDAVSIFIYSNIYGEMLLKIPNLKIVATRSTSFDHIDIVNIAGFAAGKPQNVL